MMGNITENNHQELDFKVSAVIFLLLMGILYGGYSTYQHFNLVKQVAEGNNRAFDLSILFDWSMSKFNHDVRKACNFENIQSIAKSQDFQNVNHFLELDLPIQKQGKFIENVKVYPSKDLKACIISVYFKNNSELSKDIAGKFITRHYFIQKEHSYCSTNIKNRRLVKGCQQFN